MVPASVLKPRPPRPWTQARRAKLRRTASTPRSPRAPAVYELRSGMPRAFDRGNPRRSGRGEPGESDGSSIGGPELSPDRTLRRRRLRGSKSEQPDPVLPDDPPELGGRGELLQQA